MKIRQVGAELFHAAGRSDRHDESHSRFSQFCDTRLKLVDCAAVGEDENTEIETIISLAEISTICVVDDETVGMIRPVGQIF